MKGMGRSITEMEIELSNNLDAIEYDNLSMVDYNEIINKILMLNEYVKQIVIKTNK